MNKHLLRKIIIPIVIALLLLVSSVRLLDNYADNYTSEAITAAAISYATARAINALVSMMQTTTIEAGVGISGSVAVGELLDPLNDLIERYSSVMTLVLGSLAGQKLLLLIASHQLFQMLILLFGGAAIIAYLFFQPRHFSYLLKPLLILVFIRFSLGIAVVLNGLVDASFLVDQTRSYDEQIANFRQDLSSLSNNPAVDTELLKGYRERLTQIAAEQAELTQALARLKDEKMRAEEELSQSQQTLDQALSRLTVVERYSPFLSDVEINALQLDKQGRQRNLEGVDARMLQAQAGLRTLSIETVATQKKIRGEPEGFFDGLKKKSAAVMISFDMEAIEQKLNRNIANFMNLMAIYILKTIVFPLLFFYLFVAVLRKIWSLNPADFGSD